MFADSVRLLYGSDYTVYGPYNNSKDRRNRVILRVGGKQTTRLYAKLLLEIKLGRQLIGDETVDHIDGNCLNDTVSNLQVLSKSNNSKKDAIRAVIESMPCVLCGTYFKPTRSQWSPRVADMAGPFCSKRCTGLYGKSVQLTGSTIERVVVEPTYHRNNSLKPV